MPPLLKICPFWARYTLFPSGYIMAHCSDIAWQQRQSRYGEHDEVEILQYCVLGYSRHLSQEFPKIIIIDDYGWEDIDGTTVMSRQACKLLFNTNPGIRNYIENYEWHMLEEIFLEYYGAYIGS